LLDGVRTAFMSGFHIACVVAAAICVVGAAGALLLPGRPQRPATAVRTAPAAEPAPAAA
jgi:hypothetical protein